MEEAKTKGISLGRYEVSLSADETVKSKIDNIPVKEITSLIKDKENCIYWKADNAQSSEKPETNNNLSDDKYSDKPESTLENNTIPKKDKVEEPIKEITPEVQKPIYNNKDSEINKEPEEVPETKPEIVLPPIEEIKPDGNKPGKEESEDKNNEITEDKNNNSENNTTDVGNIEQNLKK